MEETSTSTSTDTTRTHRVSVGALEVPVRYTDGAALACIYRVPLDAARAVLESECFEPLPVGGRALVQVMALEYRDTSVGPYNELGVLVLARRTGTAPSAARAVMKTEAVGDAGWFVVNLPVTTGLSCAAGRELWGFPKYVTRLDTKFDRQTVQIILGEELVIEHRVRFGVPMPCPPYVFFSELDGRLLRTVVPVEHKLHMGGARSVRVHITGDGPTSATVRTLGLDRRRPMFAFRAEPLRFSLPLGVAVGSTPIRIGSSDDVPSPPDAPPP